MELWRRICNLLRTGPRTPAYRQGEHAECGLAALAILMGHYGVHVSLAELRAEAGSTLLGSTVTSLRDLARLRGFRATAYRVEPDKLAALGLPLIAHYRFIHFVVVETVSEGFVRINDPAGGPREVPLDEFSDDFTGVVLRLHRPFGLSASGDYVAAWRRYRRLLVSRARPLAGAAIAGIAAAVTLAMGISLLAHSVAFQSVSDASAAAALIAVGLVIDGLARRLAARAVSNAASEQQRCAADAVFASPTPFILSHGPQQTRRFLSSPMVLRDARPVTAALGGASFLVLTIAGLLVSLWPGALLLLTNLVQLTILLAVSWRRGGPIARWGAGRRPVAGFTADAYGSPDWWKMSGGGDVLFRRTAGLYALHAAEALRAAASGVSLDLVMRGIDLAKAMTLVILLLGASTPSATAMALTLLLLAGASSLELRRIGRGLHLAPIANALHGLVEPPPIAPATANPDFAGARLVFSDVSWQPARLRRKIVSGVCANAAPGTILAVKGVSGSGLSTVARLAAGWLAPSSGHAMLGDVPLTQLAAGTTILVDADVPLDSASLRDNLCFGHRIDDAALSEALRDVELDEALAARGGLDLQISRERPALSGGELCRLAIARALCRRPRILVLDGVLDAVEAELAAVIAARIVSRGMVLVLTSARAETLALADSTIDLAQPVPVPA
jgi:ABC-type transport system involved in cytochrome bd biosynthesis fused ATPase/permease subunit